MIVLDTTVLVYAVGSEHPFRDPSRSLIDAASRGRLQATTTIEVLQEFVHVRARRRGRDDAALLGRSYADLLSPLLTPSTDDLLAGLSAFQAAERLGAFDAVLASTAISHGADALVSADSGFAEVRGLRHVVPERVGVDRLLGLDPS